MDRYSLEQQRADIDLLAGCSSHEIRTLRRFLARLDGLMADLSSERTEMDGYRLWVNKDRTVLVRLWDDDRVEVATREDSGAIWGPPMRLEEERRP